MSVATGSGRSSSWWRTLGCTRGRQRTSAPGACRGSSFWPVGTTTSALLSRVTNSCYGDGDILNNLCECYCYLCYCYILIYCYLLCNLTICVLSTTVPLLPGLCPRPAQAPADPLCRPQQGEPQGVGGEHRDPPGAGPAQLLPTERGWNVKMLPADSCTCIHLSCPRLAPTCLMLVSTLSLVCSTCHD